MEQQSHDERWANTAVAEEAREQSRARAKICSSRAVTIREATLPRELRREVAHLFEEIKAAGLLKNRKIAEKKGFFGLLFLAGLRANYHGACVRYPRNFHHPECSRLRLRVVDAAVKVGLFEECRSLRGSPFESRLVPMGALTDQSRDDPWSFDPPTTTYYVFLRNRGRRENLPFDRSQEVPATVQRKLTRINDVNSRFVITHKLRDNWSGEFTSTRRLRPVHVAIFHGNFELHGRLYTRRYGHQNLGKHERSTIEFDGEPSVELDYCGMHPRLLYHLNGIDFQEDPYALWGNEPTGNQRTMAKIMVNALINANSPRSAVSACNAACSARTKSGSEKKYKALEKARMLREAVKAANFTFAEIVPLVYEYHAPIKHCFASDAGMELMRIDSQIALSILDHFAERGVPCLACHDSFIVPKRARDELFEVMNSTYSERLGFMPQIK
jgi:hypothetical protein